MRDVDLFIAYITVTLELCSGGSTADVLFWDTSFLQSGSIVVDYSGNETLMYTITVTSGSPQVYTSFLR